MLPVVTTTPRRSTSTGGVRLGEAIDRFSIGSGATEAPVMSIKGRRGQLLERPAQRRDGARGRRNEDWRRLVAGSGRIIRRLKLMAFSPSAVYAQGNRCGAFREARRSLAAGVAPGKIPGPSRNGNGGMDRGGGSALGRNHLLVKWPARAGSPGWWSNELP